MTQAQIINKLEQQITELHNQNVALQVQVTELENINSENIFNFSSQVQQIQFLQKVLETFSYPAYFRDTNGRFQAGNSAWIDNVIGLPLESIANRTLPQLPKHAQSSFLRKNYEQDLDLIQSGRTTTTFEKVNCADNIVREFFIQKSVVRDNNKKASGIIGLMVDKNDLDLAELLSQNDKKSMVSSSNVLQDVLYSLPFGIMIVDADTYTILDANPQTMAMLGKSLDQIVGEHCDKFIQNDEFDSNLFPQDDESIACDETSLKTIDNKQIPILRSVLKTTIAERSCLIESFVDITESKKAEALRTEQERMKSMFELAGAVCHELNQPLMVISGFAELLEDETDNKDPKFDKINRIKDQVERMGDITRKLMRITMYETKNYLDGKIIDINNAAA